jgi:hypothetical protein
MPLRTITPKIQILWPIASTDEICKQLGVRPGVLKVWRESKAITQGIHWYYRPGTTNRILWNLDLMRDFVAIGDQNHSAHRRSIELYLKSLPSSIAS